MRVAGLGARRFNHIGINRALRKPLDVLEFRRLFVEHFDKTRPMIFRFFSGSASPANAVKNRCFGIDADYLNAHVLCECRHHLIAFAQTQQPMIDEYAGQLSTDGLVQERASTEESTPPDKPSSTRSPPTCARIRATLSSMMLRVAQRRSSRQSLARSAAVSRRPEACE